MWYVYDFTPDSWATSKYTGNSPLAKNKTFRIGFNFEYKSSSSKLHHLLKLLNSRVFSFESNPISELHKIYKIRGEYGYKISKCEQSQSWPRNCDILMYKMDKIIMNKIDHPLNKTSTIKLLRDMTNAGLSDCKNSIEEALIKDIDKTITLKELLENAKTILIANQKVITANTSDLNQGIVAFDTTSNQRTGIILGLGCKTDFAARNNEFIKLVDNIMLVALNSKPKCIADLHSLDYNKDFTVLEAISNTSALLKEPVKILHYNIIDIDPIVYKDFFIFGYQHTNNKLSSLAVILGATEDNKDKVTDILTHIAASNPLCMDRNELVPEIIQNETAGIIKKFKENPKYVDKTEEQLQKMTAGSLNKFYQDVILMEQSMSKYEKKGTVKTVQSFLKENKLTLLEFDVFQI